ncbi:MAG: hypothetical protein ABI837_06665 [Acidobacteriota bacterium]
MHELTNPLTCVHEGAGFSLTRRLLIGRQLGEPFPGKPVLNSIVPVGANSIQINAECIRRRIPTDGSVPFAVMPGHADVEMMHVDP